MFCLCLLFEIPHLYIINLPFKNENCCDTHRKTNLNNNNNIIDMYISILLYWYSSYCRDTYIYYISQTYFQKRHRVIFFTCTNYNMFIRSRRKRLYCTASPEGTMRWASRRFKYWGKKNLLVVYPTKGEAKMARPMIINYIVASFVIGITLGLFITHQFQQAKAANVIAGLNDWRQDHGLLLEH